MLGFLKKILILFLILIIAVLIVILVFPKSYEINVSTDINASQPKVYLKAKNLKSWIPFAMMGSVPAGKMKIPENAKKNMNVGGLNIGGLMGGMGKMSEMMNMKFTVIEAKSPEKIVYQIDGGPLSGVKPEINIMQNDNKTTTVTINEKYQFEGFLGSIKALFARFSTKKMHKQNLDKLKQICEK